jgi:hypothetical protein
MKGTCNTLEETKCAYISFVSIDEARALERWNLYIYIYMYTHTYTYAYKEFYIKMDPKVRAEV